MAAESVTLSYLQRGLSAMNLTVKLFAFLMALLAGALTHFLSRALGLADTVPGVIVTTALAAIFIASLREKERH